MEESTIDLIKKIVTGLNYLFQGLLLLIPFFGNITDKRRKGIKKIKRLGWYFIVSFVFSIACIITLSIITDHEDELKRIKFEDGLRKRDSANTAEIKFSDKQTIELLAKYGLEQSEYAQRIEKIVQDSTKKTVKIYNGADPLLNLNITKCSNKTDTLKITYNFESLHATSYDINLKIDLLGYDDYRNYIFYIYKNIESLRLGSVLNANQKIEPELNLIFRAKFNIYVLYVHGTYKKFDNKIITINDFYSFNILQNISGTPTTEAYNLLKKKIENGKLDF